MKTRKTLLNENGNSKLYKTKIDIPADRRTELVSLLNQRLADSIDLGTQMKQAHWNIKGPAFISLHELFDKIYNDVEQYTDIIAERVVQLGGTAEGTARISASRSRLSEYPHTISDGPSHVDAVSTALADFGKEMRLSIFESDELEDADTTDIFTEISRGVDKWLWFVEAHLQAVK